MLKLFICELDLVNYIPTCNYGTAVLPRISLSNHIKQLISFLLLQMYDIDETTGVVHLSFSVDATCTNQLHSPWEGYETMVLQPKAVIQPPSEVKSHACTFPDWARGKWQHLEVSKKT